MPNMIAKLVSHLRSLFCCTCDPDKSDATPGRGEDSGNGQGHLLEDVVNDSVDTTCGSPNPMSEESSQHPPSNGIASDQNGVPIAAVQGATAPGTPSRETNHLPAPGGTVIQPNVVPLETDVQSTFTHHENVVPTAEPATGLTEVGGQFSSVRQEGIQPTATSLKVVNEKLAVGQETLDSELDAQRKEGDVVYGPSQGLTLNDGPSNSLSMKDYQDHNVGKIIAQVSQPPHAFQDKEKSPRKVVRKPVVEAGHEDDQPPPEQAVKEKLPKLKKAGVDEEKGSAGSAQLPKEKAPRRRKVSESVAG